MADSYLFIAGRDDRFCGVPDTFRGPGCKWPQQPPVRLKWRQEVGALGPLGAAQVQACFERGLSYWAAVCNVEWVHTPSGSVHLLCVGANLGGPNGTLADCQLPCGLPADFQLRMRVDTADVWEARKLELTIAHEAGHSLGLSHSSSRSDLMFPSLLMNLTGLGPGDIREVESRYGRRTAPVPPPTPGPTPEPPAFLSGDFLLDGIEGVFRLVRSGSPESAGYPPAPLRAPGEWSGPYEQVQLVDGRGGQRWYYVGRKSTR